LDLVGEFEIDQNGEISREKKEKGKSKLKSLGE
jgi:hypothetical protein